MEGHDNDQAVLKQLDRLATEMSVERQPPCPAATTTLAGL